MLYSQILRTHTHPVYIPSMHTVEFAVESHPAPAPGDAAGQITGDVQGDSSRPDGTRTGTKTPKETNVTCSGDMPQASSLSGIYAAGRDVGRRAPCGAVARGRPPQVPVLDIHNEGYDKSNTKRQHLRRLHAAKASGDPLWLRNRQHLVSLREHHCTENALPTPGRGNAMYEWPRHA